MYCKKQKFSKASSVIVYPCIVAVAPYKLRHTLTAAIRSYHRILLASIECLQGLYLTTAYLSWDWKASNILLALNFNKKTTNFAATVYHYITLEYPHFPSLVIHTSVSLHGFNNACWNNVLLQLYRNCWNSTFLSWFKSQFSI